MAFLPKFLKIMNPLELIPPEFHLVAMVAVSKNLSGRRPLNNRDSAHFVLFQSPSEPCRCACVLELLICAFKSIFGRESKTIIDNA
jgi:hypothetical protein